MMFWKDYFKWFNIKERQNVKLHVQYLKRYWRYLNEKCSNGTFFEKLFQKYQHNKRAHSYQVKMISFH